MSNSTVRTYRWQINNFRLDAVHVSPYFLAFGKKFSIRIQPRGNTHISVYVNAHAGMNDVTLVSFSVAILDPTDLAASHSATFQTPRTFREDKCNWGWRRFADRQRFIRGNFCSADKSILVQISCSVDPSADLRLWHTPVTYMLLEDAFAPELTRPLVKKILATAHPDITRLLTDHLLKTKFTLTLRKFLSDSSLLHDVEVTVGETIFKCHRDILAAHSGYFCTLFSSESFVENQKEMATVTFVDMDDSTFADLRTFMYTGYFGMPDLEDMTELFDLIIVANRLRISGFVEQILLNIDNCLIILDASLFVSNTDLEELCNTYVCEHFATIPATSWMKISIRCLTHLTELYMRQCFSEKPRVNDLSTYEFANKIIAWFDFEDRLEYAEELIKHEIAGAFFRLVDMPVCDTQIAQLLFRNSA